MGKVVNVECALGDIFHRKTPKAFFFTFLHHQICSSMIDGTTIYAQFLYKNAPKNVSKNVRKRKK